MRTFTIAATRDVRPGMRRRRVTLATAALALASGVLLAATASPAAAQSSGLDAVCTTQSTLNFNPGLTLTPQLTQMDGGGAFFPCVSDQVVGGRFTGAGHGTLSCLGGSAEVALTIEWVRLLGGRARSTIAFASVILAGPATGLSVATVGTITDGLFKGDTYRSVFAAAPLDVQNCLLPGGSTTAVGAGTAFIERPNRAG